MRRRLCLLAALLGALGAQGQGVSVSMQVKLLADGQHDAPGRMKMPVPGSAGIVAWLSPIGMPAPAATPAHSYLLTQHNKQFSPHLLVVPTGSSVEFPNLDPFFHNVFSLFNGRRFDLGLYEAGSRRSVRFDHDGVSFIFCNIHPEMGAVIVSLSTPYYAVSDKNGSLLLLNVPSGDYELNLWSENISAASLGAARQRIHVPAQNLHLPPLTLRETASTLDRHLNKFGEVYKRNEQAPY